ncbi:MAG: S1C family serine protease [Sphingobacteriia bacterium]|jgi:serine protease Do
MYTRLFPFATVFIGGLLVGGLLFSWISDRKIARLQQQMRIDQHIQPAAAVHPSAVHAAQVPGTNFEYAASRSVHAVVYISTQGSFGRFSEASSGSGVLLTADGYLVTNHHVVAEAEGIQVTLNDKRSFPARLVGKDPHTDLAVLKIDAGTDSLPSLRMGNSDSVRIGQWVLAVGNPYQLTSTVTTGIVSAKARNIGLLRRQSVAARGQDYSIESFIQTDAAVNPGNSGGALVSLDGELIGINTAIATETGSFQGYSFAVPSQLVRKVVADLIRYGEVKRAFLGVSIQDISAHTASEYKLPTLQGALVVGLVPGGSAGRAGLRQGDVLVAVQGVPVASASELQEQVARYRPGDAIRLRLQRGGQLLEKTIRLRDARGGLGS